MTRSRLRRALDALAAPQPSTPAGPRVDWAALLAAEPPPRRAEVQAPPTAGCALCNVGLSPVELLGGDGTRIGWTHPPRRVAGRVIRRETRCTSPPGGAP